jgi:ATP adenylyltransferase/5',5'''-P-1,P-4-tetraphosphate phosphorylase II
MNDKTLFDETIEGVTANHSPQIEFKGDLFADVPVFDMSMTEKELTMAICMLKLLGIDALDTDEYLGSLSAKSHKILDRTLEHIELHCRDNSEMQNIYNLPVTMEVITWIVERDERPVRFCGIPTSL